jgi:hypothetical protein
MGVMRRVWGGFMTTIDNELICEILKAIQADVADIKKRVILNEEQLTGIRHVLIAMQSDDLRHEAAVASMRMDIDSIKNRLNFTRGH